MRLSTFTTVALAAGLTVAACKEEGSGKGAETDKSPSAAATQPAGAAATRPAGTAPSKPSAAIKASIESRSGSSVTGDVTLTETEGGVQVTATIRAPQGGTHAVHIHENGDCSAPDGKSAGDHFNPEGHGHGLPTSEQKHLGDLGNVTISEEGVGKLGIEVHGANLKPGDPKSFSGRSLIVHEKADDGGQPAGNAGARFGCAELKAM